MSYTIIHTADWHLGQSFYGYSRKNEHEYFLNQLLELLTEKEADALFISGDIFDTSNPSAESQSMYYSFLSRLASLKRPLQVIITAGNHDSAARLEAPEELLQAMNIYVRGRIHRLEGGAIDYARLIVPLFKDKELVAYCIAVPYLRPSDYQALEEESQEHGIDLFYQNCLKEISTNLNSELPIFVMGHLYTSGAVLNEDDRSERVVIGGLELNSLNIEFDERVQYIALGHLHKYQKVGQTGKIFYSGSPLPMSFAEEHYKHGVNIIRMEEQTTIERHELAPLVTLLSIPKKSEDADVVLKALESLPQGEMIDNSPFIRIQFQLESPRPELKTLVEDILKDKSVRLALTKIEYKHKNQGLEDLSLNHRQLITNNPLELSKKVYLDKYGEEMPIELVELMSNLIKEVEL